MILRRFDEALMPVRCVFCGLRCGRHEPHICEGCLEDLPWRERLVEPAAPPLAAVLVPLCYAFPVDAALKALKFRRRLDYVPAFAELLWRVSRELPPGVDAFLPVPLHWRRHAIRGFNQASELCKVLRKRAGWREITSVRRVRATPKQSGLDAAARRRNLRDAFATPERIEAQHVLIVDDVITTGETTRTLARALQAAGAQQVSVLAVART